MKMLSRIAVRAGLAMAACLALGFSATNLWAEAPPGDPRFKPPKPPKQTMQQQMPKQAQPQRPPMQQQTPRQAQQQRPPVQQVAPQQHPPRQVQPMRPPVQRVAPLPHPPRHAVAPPPPHYAPPPPAPRRHHPPYWAAAVPLLVLPSMYYAATPPPPPPVPPLGAELVVAYADNLKVRDCPRTDCTIIGRLQRGTPVQLLDYRSRFARVRVVGTTYEGWVQYKYLAPHPVPGLP